MANALFDKTFFGGHLLDFIKNVLDLIKKSTFKQNIPNYNGIFLLFQLVENPPK